MQEKRRRKVHASRLALPPVPGEQELYPYLVAGTYYLEDFTPQPEWVAREEVKELNQALWKQEDPYLGWEKLLHYQPYADGIRQNIEERFIFDSQIPEQGSRRFFEWLIDAVKCLGDQVIARPPYGPGFRRERRSLLSMLDSYLRNPTQVMDIVKRHYF